MSSTSLIAVRFHGPAEAERALDAISAVEAEHGLRLKDAAVVVRKQDGGVELRQARELAAGEGIVGGGAIGLLVGLVLGAPVAAAIIGVAGGGGLSALDRGISDSGMRRIGAELEPGSAALFALVADVDWPRLRGALAPYGGEVLSSEVADDVVAALAP
jgi:uncharacterized membrane protein